MTAFDSAANAALMPPAVPGWAIPRGPVTSDTEAAFLAGAALNSLDNLVCAAPAWAGAWRQRLALKCATAAVALAGRTEDEAALRDAWHLRAAGADPGPSGNIFAAWRRMASRSPVFDVAMLRSVADLFGVRWSQDLGRLPADLDAVTRSGRPAPLIAAQVMIEVQRLRPDAGLLGWWLADQALAARMRWPVAVPLFVTQARGAAFRGRGERSRVRPEGEGFERAVCVALALAAAEACRIAGEIAPRATRLVDVAPKLRARGASEAIRFLLDEDAVSGTLQTQHLTRWGSRRLFERLTALEAVRELSGRTSFRLYGL